MERIKVALKESGRDKREERKKKKRWWDEKC